MNITAAVVVDAVLVAAAGLAYYNGYKVAGAVLVGVVIGKDLAGYVIGQALVQASTPRPLPPISVPDSLSQITGASVA